MGTLAVEASLASTAGVFLAVLRSPALVGSVEVGLAGATIARRGDELSRIHLLLAAAHVRDARQTVARQGHEQGQQTQEA
jgi:hypothetical protein